jgi:hypothetical protein
MLWKKGVLPCAAIKLAAVVIQVLWCKEGCAMPMLSCMQSCCHDPQNALVEEGWLSCAAMQLTAVAITSALVQGRVCYPYAVMHASCCHDPQNALVEEGVLSLRCHAKLAAVVIHECQLLGRCAILLSCKLAAV